MSYGYPVVLWSDKVARSQMQEVTFYFRITAAQTLAPLNLINNPVLLGFDAGDMSQAVVESFLGHKSTSDAGTIFDATSLGANTLGFVVDMAGQVDLVYGAMATVYIAGTGAGQLVQATQAALASANTSAVAEYDGDVYGRLVVAGLDAATDGFVELKILFKSK